MICHDYLGASVKYVCTEGRGRVQKKLENMLTIVLIGCVKSVQEGEGVKKAGKSAYVLNGCSLRWQEKLKYIFWAKI